MAINLKNLLKLIKSNERYLGLIIYGPPMIGKTNYFEKFVKTSELLIELVDCLNIFNKYNGTDDILRLTPKTCLEFVKEYIQTNTISDFIILDHIDALFNIWSKQKQNDFIGRAIRIEKSSFNIPIITVLNSKIVLDELPFQKSDELLKRIIKFKKLEAI